MLTTDRLFIKKFQLTNAAFVLELVNTDAWLKYIGNRKVYTLRDAEKYLQNRLIAAYEKYSFGMYVIWYQAQKCPIGMCGLVQRDYLSYPDLGFEFQKEIRLPDDEELFLYQLLLNSHIASLG
ncbi:MAG: GNAT family N-acetyltransferase [Bacteroidota bacterium]